MERATVRYWPPRPILGERCSLLEHDRTRAFRLPVSVRLSLPIAALHCTPRLMLPLYCHCLAALNEREKFRRERGLKLERPSTFAASAPQRKQCCCCARESIAFTAALAPVPKPCPISQDQQSFPPFLGRLSCLPAPRAQRPPAADTAGARVEFCSVLCVLSPLS